MFSPEVFIVLAEIIIASINLFSVYMYAYMYVYVCACAKRHTHMEVTGNWWESVLSFYLSLKESWGLNSGHQDCQQESKV